jgi:hypothetical protein
MSCCYECEQSGMGCYGQSEYPLLGGLLGQAFGLENVVAGSQVRVGFEYRIDRAGGYDLSATQDLPKAIRDCLYRYGYFQNVRATIAPGWINDYVTIEGVTAVDFLFSEDIGELVHQALAECLPFLSINKRDTVKIDAIPQGSAGNPNIAQPTGAQSGPLYTGGQNQASQTGAGTGASPKQECKWSEMSFGDFVACQLGIKGTVGGIAAGATGALVGVGALTILAVVLLKR